jgi:hypothetical protein
MPVENIQLVMRRVLALSKFKNVTESSLILHKDLLIELLYSIPEENFESYLFAYKNLMCGKDMNVEMLDYLTPIPHQALSFVMPIVFDVTQNSDGQISAESILECFEGTDYSVQDDWNRLTQFFSPNNNHAVSNTIIESINIVWRYKRRQYLHAAADFIKDPPTNYLEKFTHAFIQVLINQQDLYTNTVKALILPHDDESMKLMLIRNIFAVCLDHFSEVMSAVFCFFDKNPEFKYELHLF